MTSMQHCPAQPPPSKTAATPCERELVEREFADLESRFSVVTTTVEVAGRVWELRRPKSCEDLISEEDFDRDERLPYWADIWPSSHALAAHVARLDGAGRRFLELGCGVGLVALAAAHAGFRVTASDYYTEALEFTAHNARHNARRQARDGARGNTRDRATPEISTRLLDWRQWPDDLGRFDVIAASDVLYERPNSALVAAVLDRALAPDGVALVSDPGRMPAAPFATDCRSRGLDARPVEATAPALGKTSLTISIFEIRRSGRGEKGPRGDVADPGGSRIDSKSNISRERIARHV
jgi:predicted nicotinamide N-methyase